jgi:enoyl-CoA hydratase
MSLLRYALRDGVAVMTLDRPEKRNAIDPALATAIEAAIDRYESDDRVRVAVLEAEMLPGHPVFCAGHDLQHFRDTLGTVEEDAVTTPSGGFAGLTRKSRSKPLIAAVDGLATAGGCEMVLACDLVIASERAAFAIAEAKWNLVASGGGAFRLPRAVGRSVAMDMLLTAEPISGQRAFELGLVSRLAPVGAVSELAFEVAATIAANGPLAVALSRCLIEMTGSVTDDQAWRLLERAAALVRESGDLREGLSAFVERRAARWSNC